MTMAIHGRHRLSPGAEAFPAAYMTVMLATQTSFFGDELELVRSSVTDDRMQLELELHMGSRVLCPHPA